MGTAPHTKPRIVEIDFSRAFAIILVVIGHWNVEIEPSWWKSLIKTIYTFHMPLFLAVSGYIYIYTSKPGQSYFKFLIKKIKRLLVPYFFTSIIIITIKYLTQGNAYMENPVTLKSYIEIFYSPEAGYFLWFIWALWWMFVLAPLFKTKQSHLVLLAITLVLHYLSLEISDLFALTETSRMMLWFVVGMVLCDFKDQLNWKSRVNTAIATVVLIGLLTAYYCGGEMCSYIIPYVAIYTIPALMYVVSKHITPRFYNGILSIATASYIIYLFHTTIEGFVKAIYMKLPDLNDPYIFVIGVIAGVLAGVLVPWALYYFFKRYNATGFMFGIK